MRKKIKEINSTGSIGKTNPVTNKLMRVYDSLHFLIFFYFFTYLVYFMWNKTIKQNFKVNLHAHIMSYPEGRGAKLIYLKMQETLNGIDL